jgi:hypothetical protein
MNGRLEWVLVEEAGAGVEVGDIVSTQAGGMPTYKVIELDGGVACLRDERQTELTMPIDHFLWKACDAD